MAARKNLLCRSDKCDVENLNKFAASKIAADRARANARGFARVFSRFYFKLKHSA
jgi:hypothetical protein